MNARPRTILLLLLLLLAAPLATADPIPEYRVKAAFLHNFGKYVSWPATAFGSSATPFVIGILGDDPFGEEFTPLLRKSVQNRSVVIRRLVKSSDVRGCHILFISRSEERRLAEILAAVNHGTTLTVSDMADFIRHGGMIQLFLEDSRVHFNINLKASRAAGLAISSNMLQLAGTILE